MSQTTGSLSGRGNGTFPIKCIKKFVPSYEQKHRIYITVSVIKMQKSLFLTQGENEKHSS